MECHFLPEWDEVMGKEKYAVVIATRNRLTLLRECIRCASCQTILPEKIIIVDNASDDGTGEYLTAGLKEEGYYLGKDRYEMVRCPKNLGGAGGFREGVKRAADLGTDWVLLIDDDAMLQPDYASLLLREAAQGWQVLAGTVRTGDVIDSFHRRNITRYGLFSRPVGLEAYRRRFFFCDVASFCGVMIDRRLVECAGLPEQEYFIYHDDTEYLLRFLRMGIRTIVVTDAVLNHRTDLRKEKKPRRYTWKDYYAIRNRLLYVGKHGTKTDVLWNRLDIWIRVTFRNRLFGLLKRDGYDWKYECETGRRAVRDAKERIAGEMSF